MSSSTTTSPVQDIAAAEHAAAQKVEDAKKLAAKEVEAFRKDESSSVENSKKTIKEEATNELKKEKTALGEILKDGDAETKKQVKSLREICEGNTPEIVKDLVDQCISLTP